MQHKVRLVMRGSGRPVCQAPWEHQLVLNRRESWVSINTGAARGQAINHCSAQRQTSSWVNIPNTIKDDICPAGVVPFPVPAHGKLCPKLPAGAQHTLFIPRVALHQPTKHKPVQDVQGTLPLPQQATQPCAQMALQPRDLELSNMAGWRTC